MSFASPPSKPKPDQRIFEERPLSVKKPRLAEALCTPKRCPSTPLRTTPIRRTPIESKHKACLTDLKPTHKTSNDFQMHRKLGEGSFGTVYEATSIKDSKVYAIKKSKVANWATQDRANQVREIKNCRAMGVHSNILEVIDAWEEGGHIYIQMELCKSSLKDLLSEANPVSEETIWRYLSDIVLGLHHMKNYGMMHLDIKPENLLLTVDDSIKIADFGCSGTANSLHLSEGDKLYMAPELLEDKFSHQADIFSAGLCLYEMVTGYEMPADGMSWRLLREGKAAFIEETQLDFSDELKELILQMIDPIPENRPTTDTLSNHPQLARLTKSTPPSSQKKRCHRSLEFTGC